MVVTKSVIFRILREYDRRLVSILILMVVIIVCSHCEKALAASVVFPNSGGRYDIGNNTQVYSSYNYDSENYRLIVGNKVLATYGAKYGDNPSIKYVIDLNNGADYIIAYGRSGSTGTFLYNCITTEYVNLGEIDGLVYDTNNKVSKINTDISVAKTAAQNAKTSADNANTNALKATNQLTTKTGDTIRADVLNLKTDMGQLTSKINNIQTTINNLGKVKPEITTLQGLNNATATKTSTFVLDTSVSNATHYRINDGDWQEYTQSQLIINNISKGVNRIEVEFGNFPITTGEGRTDKGILTIFGL